MLDPGDRTLYTEALVPPPGLTFDFAVATTYSLDLGVLLAVPLHLVLASSEDTSELMQDPVTLYESLQRVVGRLRIYTQVGGIHAPKQPHLLYSLLERSVYQVEAPRGGAFHPKVWVLRYLDVDGGATYRLIVLSRNITADRSWDVALTLEGRVTSVPTENSALVKLFRILPELSGSTSDELVDQFLEELRFVRWELPDGCDQLDLHLLGIDEDVWMPMQSEQLYVFSPFISDATLSALAETTDRPVALISRSESLAELRQPIPFRRVYVLHEAAETEDGEDLQGAGVEIGLHAKVFISRTGSKVAVAVGSANATNAALVARHNVEFMAVLHGNLQSLGNPRWLLDPERKGGLGQMLMPWDPEFAVSVDQDRLRREAILEEARRTLARADLALRCYAVSSGWEVELTSTEALRIEGVESFSCWPVTLRRDRAVSASPLVQDRRVVLPVQTLESITGLIAFEFGVEGVQLAFSLNLPIADVPEDRDGAILRQVISNQDGFMRYLLLLLAGLGDGAEAAAVARSFSNSGFIQFHSVDDLPLLEEMTRAFCRDPSRLTRVKRLVEELCTDEAGRQTLPDGFMEFWEVFETAMSSEKT